MLKWYMITDLIQIKRLGEQKREENLRFRKYLKTRVWVERQFHKAAQEVHAQIDCLACAECCRVTEVEITERDIEKLAKFLGIRKVDFEAQYTHHWRQGRDDSGAHGEIRLCFLSGNECTVYEARPANCERFPHLLKGMGSIPSRMWQFVDRATYCPIVYNWMEEAKKLTKFRGEVGSRGGLPAPESSSISSKVRGQSSRSKRLRARSASSFPPVWHGTQ